MKEDQINFKILLNHFRQTKQSAEGSRSSSFLVETVKKLLMKKNFFWSAQFVLIFCSVWSNNAAVTSSRLEALSRQLPSSWLTTRIRRLEDPRLDNSRLRLAIRKDPRLQWRPPVGRAQLAGASRVARRRARQLPGRSRGRLWSCQGHTRATLQPRSSARVSWKILDYDVYKGTSKQYPHVALSLKFLKCIIQNSWKRFVVFKFISDVSSFPCIPQVIKDKDGNEAILNGTVALLKGLTWDVVVEATLWHGDVCFYKTTYHSSPKRKSLNHIWLNMLYSRRSNAFFAMLGIPIPFHCRGSSSLHRGSSFLLDPFSSRIIIPVGFPCIEDPRFCWIPSIGTVGYPSRTQLSHILLSPRQYLIVCLC